MPSSAFVFVCTDGPVGKQHIIKKLTSKDHKWITCSQEIAKISRNSMKYPQNFHGATSGLNTSLNLSRPSVDDVKNQAFTVTFEGSKQCTTTGACGLSTSISSLEVNK